MWVSLCGRLPTFWIGMQPEAGSHGDTVVMLRGGGRQWSTTRSVAERGQLPSPHPPQESFSRGLRGPLLSFVICREGWLLGEVVAEICGLRTACFLCRSLHIVLEGDTRRTIG